ncbi:MAG: Lrp/AsnC family transcriptional regulator, partial [Candidatus Micrarchaeia archaeon]
EGVIEGFTILVNPKKLGYEIRAIIGIDAPPERYMEIMELLKVDPNVRRMYISSGDHMFMAECWFKDSEEMATFIKTLNQKEGIVKVCPAIIHEIVKC